MDVVATHVKERPILFSGPMVRAILAGTKTQTRRVLDRQPFERGGLWQLPMRTRGRAAWYVNEEIRVTENKVTGERTEVRRVVPIHEWLLRFCPYGAAGDRLWVRETWEDSGLKKPFTMARGGPELPPVLYAADLPATWQGHTEYRRRPSIFMPRWASRLTLEISEVRVQRLQEISEEDAKAEGIPFDGTWYLGGIHPVKGTLQCWPFAKTAFERTWDAIQLARDYRADHDPSWKANPWVWAITFKRLA